ncbi:MAG: carboxy terminal-processing peptidase [Verrucomicrobiota bacterium JB022]|nr:carboxy terminal-processing peptidase [Verrucomicrobiota bacterium JB022]
MNFRTPLNRWMASGMLASAFALSSPSAFGLEVTRDTRERLKKETIYAIDMIQRYHYKQKPFQELDAVELIDTYMEDLDGSRLFFLREDQDFAHARFGDSMKRVYLISGDLFPAFEIYDTYEKRVTDRLAWIKERLTKPLDLESDKTYETDRSEVAYPADQADADDLWERRLTFEVVSEMLEDVSYDEAVEKVQKRYDRFSKQMKEMDVHSVQETFLTSLAQLYDPHSNFFSWDSTQEFNIAISNSLIGIGAQLRQIEETCVIERLLPGGPAEMSGELHPGDKIVAVAQGTGVPVDVMGMKLRDIVKMIRGEEGSEVRLTIEPANETGRKVISLNRDKVELTANLAHGEIHEVPMGEDQLVPIGVIKLSSFYGEGTFDEADTSTSRDVKELITKLEEHGVKGLVLDLRNNGGGRLEEAVALAGLFIPTGPVVQKRNYDGQVDTDWDKDPSVAYDGPLVVLTSKQSASASEIVAGALKAYGRALIVGDTTTHGKGTVQAPIDLRNMLHRRAENGIDDVGMVKITIQKFYLPDGASTQNKGVPADIVLPSATEFLLEGEAQLDHALAWDTIPPVEFALRSNAQTETVALDQVNDILIKELSQRSLDRQHNLPEFQFWQRNLDWLRKKNDQTSVSLNLDARRVQKTEDETLRDQFEEERLEFRKHRFPMQEVDLALTAKKDEEHQEKLRSTPLPDGRDRANQFYQKVFYYSPENDAKIHEVWVEYLNYEEGLDHAEELATTLSETSGEEISTEQMETVLNGLKHRDRTQTFNPHANFAEALGDGFTAKQIDDLLPVFFREMVQYDPDVLEDRPNIDVELRESMRILSDWIVLANHEESPFETVTAKEDSKHQDDKMAL